MDKTPFNLRQSLNKAYLKEKVARPAIEHFKNCLRTLLSNIDLEESETNVRDHLRDFLNDIWYKNDFLLASKERTDLVIHGGKTAKSPAAVLLEVKRPKNAGEMVSTSDLNRKALQELVYYYLRERETTRTTASKRLLSPIYTSGLCSRKKTLNVFSITIKNCWNTTTTPKPPKRIPT